MDPIVFLFLALWIAVSIGAGLLFGRVATWSEQSERWFDDVPVGELEAIPAPDAERDQAA